MISSAKSCSDGEPGTAGVAWGHRAITWLYSSVSNGCMAPSLLGSKSAGVSEASGAQLPKRAWTYMGNVRRSRPASATQGAGVCAHVSAFVCLGTAP